jgi:nucleotide-binding universal stress UspA family protein
MIKKILVPLDGSKLAECALPYVEEIATKMAVDEVVLISVTERIKGFRPIEDPNQPSGQTLIPEGTGKMEKQAQKYLNRIAKGLEAKGVKKVVNEVPFGDPAEEIIFYADTKGCDLIIIASHGRGGPSRWIYGSIAEKVFRALCAPVLMVRAPGCSPSV